MTMKKVTMQDIANELGITKTTVHRVMKGHPHVSDSTRKMVLELAEKYAYIPNSIARSLSLLNKRTRIGVIIQTKPEFFWEPMLNGMQAYGKVLRDFGIELSFCPISNRRHESLILEGIARLREEGIQALALVPLDSESVRAAVDDLVGKGIPVVTYNDDMNRTRRLFYVGPRIRQSGRVAGELMAKFLRGKGNVVAISGKIGRAHV